MTPEQQLLNRYSLLYQYQSLKGETWTVRSGIHEGTNYVFVGRHTLSDLFQIAIPTIAPTFCLEHRALNWESYLLANETFSSAQANAILDRQLPLLLDGKQAVATFYLDETATTSRDIIESRLQGLSDELAYIPGPDYLEVCLASTQPLTQFFQIAELRFIFGLINEIVKPETTTPFQLSEADWQGLSHVTVSAFMKYLNKQPTSGHMDKSDWRNYHHRSFMTSLLNGTPLLVAIGGNYPPYCFQ